MNRKILVSFFTALVLLLSACAGNGVVIQDDTTSAYESCEELLSLTQMSASTQNLMAAIKTGVVTGTKANEKFVASSADFAVELFKRSLSDKNQSTLVSPLSVLLALSMTANGANGKTKTEFEKVLGNNMTIEELNAYLFEYMQSLPSSEDCKLNIANSIWIKNVPNFNVNNIFLQVNADYYGASAYRSAFDNQTVNDINLWVSEKTDGMIPSMLDNIPDEAVMYLINALVFDAKWDTVYEDQQVQPGTFHSFDNVARDVSFMSSKERGLHDDNAIGFIKDYKGGKYSFAAMLPDKNTSIEEYVASLTGEKLLSILRSPRDVYDVKLPEFENEYSITLNDALKNMGLKQVFDPSSSDLSGIAGGVPNLYVNNFLHKTFISVNRQGTKAAAATVGGIAPTSLPPKPIILDRPFVYMIIDNSTNLPIFIGTVMDITP